MKIANPLNRIADGTKQANVLGGIALSIALIALIVAVSKGGKK